MIDGLSEGEAHTEGYTCYYKLEVRNLKEDCICVARPVRSSIFGVNRSTLIPRVVSGGEEQSELDTKLD